MPKKTVREMTKRERIHYSLSSRVFRATMMGAILLGLVALAIGLGLYTWAVVRSYVSDAFNLSRSAAKIIDEVVYVDPLAVPVLDLYGKLSEEEKNEVGTDAYRERFSYLKKDPTYLSIINILNDFKDGSDVNDIYLGTYLQDPSVLLYFADPERDPEFLCDPGDWEPVSAKEVEKFLTWDGTGMLYDISKTDKYGWMCTAGMPIRSLNGELQAFVLADVTLHEVGAGMKTFLFQYIVAMFLVVNLFGVLLTLHMRKNLVNPINEIADAAVRYVEDKRSGEQVTDHFAMLNIRTGDEVENLSLVMADMERDLSEYVESLTRITAEKERIGTELALATRIQADMLPSIFPPFPEHNDIDIFASMDPAKEVGGDFYDFFLIDEDHLALVIADVSGKGVPAALFMMVSKILIQNHVLAGLSPKSVLETLNRQICKNNREEMFVTVWLAILDLRTGDLTAANAGHEYPMLRSPKGEYELYKDKHGLVVGSIEGIRYSEYRLKIEPGAKIFVYTDGVPEATNASNELFGIERTLEALNSGTDRTPQEDIEAVTDAIWKFVGEAPQFDDLTMLCLRYNGRQMPKPEKQDPTGSEQLDKRSEI